MNYSDAVNYIEQSGVRGSVLGLERMKCLCECLGNPQDELKFIHIAGTNGKGSTACFISTILSEAGYRTGLYYSPAMTGIKDHYSVNAELISDDDYTDCVEQLIDANKKVYNILGEEATQFEIETALAFLYFRKSLCDIVVLETGLGGRDDATNVVKNKLACVFTSISLDHTAVLGETLREIATVKVGIVTPDADVTVALSVAQTEAIDVINEICSNCGILPVVADEKCLASVMTKDDNGRYPLSLKGDFQNENAALAVCTVKKLISRGYCISDEAISRALKKAYWPFRFEKISSNPPVYVDGAHNPAAAYSLARTVESEFSGVKIILVMGMFKDKDYEQVISILAPMASEVVALTTPNNVRALGADVICSVAEKYCSKIYRAEDVRDAARYAMLRENDNKGEASVILACGSLSYLNEFKRNVNELLGK